MTSRVYDVDPHQLEKIQGQGAFDVFLRQMECLSTFGLYSSSELNSSLTHHNQEWNALCYGMQDRIQHVPCLNVPILIMSVSVNPFGEFIINFEPEVEISLLYLFSKIPNEIIVLLVMIPSDPVQFASSVYSRIEPISHTEDCKRACEEQCSPYKLSNLELLWKDYVMSLLHNRKSEVFKEYVANSESSTSLNTSSRTSSTVISEDLYSTWIQRKIQQVLARTFYLCIPSLLITHQWTYDSEMLSKKDAADRQHQFVWSFILPRIPRFEHCISWLALDPSHVLSPSRESVSLESPWTQMDIPFSDSQFVNTMVVDV